MIVAAIFAFINENITICIFFLGSLLSMLI